MGGMTWVAEQASPASESTGAPDEPSFRFFYDKSPLMMGTVALCPDGDILHVYGNLAASRFFGRAPGAAHGQRARSLGVPEAVVQLWRAHYEMSAATGESIRFDYPHPVGAGERRLSVTVAPLGAEDRSGFPLFSYVAEDVTERRRAQEALRDSEARLRVLASAIPALVFETDPNGGGAWVNARVIAYTGLAERALLGQGWLQIVHPEDRDRAVEAWRQPWAEGTTYEDQYRLRRADGLYRWHAVRASPVCADDGRITAWFGACVDIETQKATEARLIERELSLTMALEIGQMGTWRRKIGDMRALTVSTEQVRLYGFPAGFTPREPDFRALYAPEDWARLIAAREAFDRTGEPSDTVVPFRRYDTGESRWVLIRRQVLAWADGRPAEEIGVVIDITERRENETRLRLMMDELNHRVKNNLATMVSIAAQTAKACQDIPDFLGRFTGRIQALSQSNELLTHTSWRDVELKAVLASALRPFAAGAVSMRGPEALKVDARVAVALSLVLHELGTNAIKYGAFSADGGRLEVAWRTVDAAHAEIVWTETSVRPVTAPAVSGFGTKLIRRLAAADLGGDAKLSFEPGGVAATIRFKRAAEADV